MPYRTTVGSILRSSKGRAHVMWRVECLGIRRVEALQKHLSRGLGTDTAATSAAQLTRLPGFYNHKYHPPQLVVVDYGDMRSAYAAQDFPEAQIPAAPPASAASEPIRRRRGSMPTLERARRYLAATPPAIQGQRGDERTFRLCCRLVGRFGLTDDEALSLLADWNRRCEPPWTATALADKVRRSRTHAVRARDAALTGQSPSDRLDVTTTTVYTHRPCTGRFSESIDLL